MKKLLFEVFFTRIWMRVAILIVSLLSTLFGILGPYFQMEFINHLLTGKFSDLPLTHWLFQKYLFVGPLTLLTLSFICLLFSLTLSQGMYFIGFWEARILQRNFSQQLYDKILSFRSDTLSGKSLGEMISVYATDIPGSAILMDQILPQGASIIFPLFFAPYALAHWFEVPIGLTLVLMGAMFVINVILGYRQGFFFFKFKALAAFRLSYVNEWIQNIRTLRVLKWVSFFEKKIIQARESETLNRVAMVSNGQVMNSLNSTITFVLNVTTLSSILIFSHKEIHHGKLMALLWIIGIFLSRPFRQMPWLFTFFFDSWTSLKRIAEVLSIENRDPYKSDNLVKISSELFFSSQVPISSQVPSLHVKNLQLRLSEADTLVLNSISFDIPFGEFVAIVGEVGSGKSLLLLSLLGETSAHFEEYHLAGRDVRSLTSNELKPFFSYLPQEAFIMSASLRENVAFEYDYPKKEDSDMIYSLRNVQFGPDLEAISQGLDVEIGERGVNLSGGQKQRVSLARVHFNETPIILLDDCLSAIDVNTEKELIHQLLHGEWKEKTRILATHRWTVLDKVDRVFYMENGEMIAMGKYEDLLQKNEKFRNFILGQLQTKKMEVFLDEK